MNPIALIFGTRAEIIKLSPVIEAAIRTGVPYKIIHTNQHYSHGLDALFFEELGLPTPDYNLNVGPGTQIQQISRMIERLEPILGEIKPTSVIVQGDTNSVLAGTLVASRLHIPVAHIEAGLRSYDRAMPEEINRIMTDHISTFLFPPTEACANTLRTEGIAEDMIHMVGNTIVDAVLGHSSTLVEAHLEKFNLKAKQYFLLTLHRPANVDSKEDLLEIVSFLEKIHGATGKQFFFPAHPRTKGSLEKYNISLPECVQLVEPVGYLDMLTLQKFAHTVFTDSGGLQEESCILGTPCLTLRDSTERPETVTVGANVVVFRDATKALDALDHFPKNWVNPFGDGHTSEQILSVLSRG